MRMPRLQFHYAYLIVRWFTVKCHRALSPFLSGRFEVSPL